MVEVGVRENRRRDEKAVNKEAERRYKVIRLRVRLCRSPVK